MILIFLVVNVALAIGLVILHDLPGHWAVGTGFLILSGWLLLAMIVRAINTKEDLLT